MLSIRNIAIAAAVLVTGFIIAVTVCICRKRRSSSSSQEQGRVDMNPVYGECEAYYEGQERMQVEDASPYYGAGEECWDDVATDRNAH